MNTQYPSKTRFLLFVGALLLVMASACTTNILALAIDPTNPNIIYAGTLDNGIFKSTNGGKNWRAANAGLTNLEVNSLVIDPKTSTTIYAGTWDGIFKSIDGGKRWAKIDLSATGVFAMVIDPAMPITLYAGTNNGDMFKSTDGGRSWNVINNGLTGFRVESLAIDPLTPTTIYLAKYSDGVFKSTDGGQNWINIGLTENYIWSLAIDPITPATIYVGTDHYEGVFRSTDGGENWSGIKTGLPNIVVRSLAIDPSKPNTIYAGTWSGLFKSTDSGETWNMVNTNLDKFEIHTLAIDPITPTIIYAGTYNKGVFKSTDGGNTWHQAGASMVDVFSFVKLNGLTPALLMIIAFFLMDGFIIYYANRKAIKRSRMRDIIIQKHASSFVNAVRFPICYCSQKRFYSIWKWSVWETSGVIFLDKQSLFVYFENDTDHPFIIDLDSPQTHLNWVGLQAWPNGFIYWFSIISNGEEHYFTSETGTFVFNSRRKTQSIYNKLKEQVEIVKST